MIGAYLAPKLGPLVAGRFRMNTFIDPGKQAPVVPAIRGTLIASTPNATMCGTDDEHTDDVRVQIDCVDATYAGVVTLRQAVEQVLMATGDPWIRNSASETFDNATNLHRSTLDMTLLLQSGGSDSPTSA